MISFLGAECKLYRHRHTMVVMIYKARNAGRFCLLVAIGMMLGGLMIMYILSSESSRTGHPPGSRKKLPPDRKISLDSGQVKEHAYLLVTEENYRKRNGLVQESCKKLEGSLPDLPTPPMPSHFLVDDAYKIIYFWVPKVASGNWKSTLCHLKESYSNGQWTPNFHNKNLGIPSLQEYPDEERKKRMNSYFKYVFVRHPFERLLSAYRGRFEAKGRYKSRGMDDFSSFGKFVDYLTEMYTNKEVFNIHWRPQTDLCKPCEITYDFIGHFETLQEDVNFLFKHLNFTGTGFHSKVTYATGSSDPLVMQKYYSNLTRSQIDNLYRIYAHDFDLFGYTKNY
ncbi:carbohydrate sulfotransferase 11-like [Glandiceps talaboti]